MGDYIWSYQKVQVIRIDDGVMYVKEANIKDYIEKHDISQNFAQKMEISYIFLNRIKLISIKTYYHLSMYIVRIEH